MAADCIIIDGQAYEVVANWNALVAFLKEVGRDTMDGLTGAGQLSPSDIAPLMCACVNEGLRKKGSEKRFTTEEIGDLCDITTMGAFMQIYVGQVMPKNSAASAEAKKK